MSASQSRGSIIDTEKCVDQAGSRYDLILMATARAKEIKRRNQSSMKPKHVGAPVTALLEIQAGEVSTDYFSK